MWPRENAHVNEGLEILLSVRGEDWFGMDGTMHRCFPGCLFLIDSGVPHDAYYPQTSSGLAHFSGYSKFHLSRIFRTWIGCSIHQYIDTSRQRKMESMKTAGYSNRAIAEALGFSEASAYLRWRRGHENDGAQALRQGMVKSDSPKTTGNQQ